MILILFYLTLWANVCLAEFQPATSYDEGFRLKDGFCQRAGLKGFNKDFLGECGQTARRLNNVKMPASVFRGFSSFEANFSDSEFQNADFSFSELKMCRIKTAHFEKSQFRSAILTGCSLFRTSFALAQFQDSDLSAIKAVEADFSSAILTNAKLVGAQLMMANLNGADLRGADLTLAHLDMANLKGSIFNKRTKLPISVDAAKKRGMIWIDE